jgi:hypothetical protein
MCRVANLLNTLQQTIYRLMTMAITTGLSEQLGKPILVHPMVMVLK